MESVPSLFLIKEDSCMRICELPSEERPRERLMKFGAEALANYELIAILLRTGSGELSALGLAQKLLSLDDRGLGHLAEMSFNDFCGIDGIGKAKAAELMAALEIGKRLSTMPRTSRVTALNSEVISQIFMEEMRYYKQEYAKLLLLNIKGEVLGNVKIAMGDLTGTIIHPRDVFREAISHNAAGVVLIHNHPSGDPTPSLDDKRLTERLSEAGRLLGVMLVDHIIIGDGVYLSFRDTGLLKMPSEERKQDKDTGG